MFLEPIPTKNAVITSKLPTGDTRISHCRVFKTFLRKEVAQKLNCKRPKRVKKT